MSYICIELFQDKLFSGNGKRRIMLLFFLSEPTSRPSILDTIQNYTEKPGNTFSRGCILSIPTRLRLRLTYIRPDWVNVNNNILSVALWHGAALLCGIPMMEQHKTFYKVRYAACIVTSKQKLTRIVRINLRLWL